MRNPIAWLRTVNVGMVCMLLSILLVSTLSTTGAKRDSQKVESSDLALIEEGNGLRAGQHQSLRIRHRRQGILALEKNRLAAGAGSKKKKKVSLTKKTSAEADASHAKMTKLLKASTDGEDSSDESDTKGESDTKDSSSNSVDNVIKDEERKSGAEEKSSAPVDAAISTSSNKDSEVVVPIDVVIPDSYNPVMLPKPKKGPVQVKLRILLEQIYGVKQIDHTITVGIRTFALWKDSRLAFNSSQHLKSGMSYYQVNPDNIWTPRIEILNVVGTDQTYQSAQVYPDGSVFLTTRMMSIVTVKFAAQWFPFDRQKFIFEFGELGYSKDLVYLNTTTTDWSPAFEIEEGGMMEKIHEVVKKAETDEASSVTAEDTVKSASTEEKFKEPMEMLQTGNFILGIDVMESSEGDAYWIVDNFEGWQGLRFGEGARYYYVGVSTLLEMHRGREHFILVYILPLVFIITVSQVNWFFDVRDLDPRLTIASGLLLCMVAFQYTIEQELPKVSYPLWINYYMVGCYVMIVSQCALMVLVMRIAGRRIASNGRWSRKTVESWVDVGSPGPSEKDTSVPQVVRDQWERERLAEMWNWIFSIAYPTCFLLFNIVMFSLVIIYT